MKFKMNDREWEIIELSQEEIRQHIIDYKYDGNPIYINKEVLVQAK